MVSNISLNDSNESARLVWNGCQGKVHGKGEQEPHLFSAFASALLWQNTTVDVLLHSLDR